MKKTGETYQRTKMAVRIVGMVGVMVALSLASALSCVGQQKFELQAFGGYKYGGGVDVAPNLLGINRINVDSSVSYGATATFNPAARLGFEFLWDRQPTHATGSFSGGGTYPTKIGFTMDQYHGNILFSFADHESKVEPFVLVGFGASDMHGGGSSTTKFSFGVGGGVKYFMTRHLGFRAQARYTPTYAYTSNGGVWCNWWGYCWVVPNDHFIHQGDVTGGVVLRF
ncbi:MAG TPA: outer membrane beta-barrel protein [Dongiaceae bacterium]|nr:outer membrane beta-barrel protein [Dongiaceae bacterium]